MCLNLVDNINAIILTIKHKTTGIYGSIANVIPAIIDVIASII